MSDPSVAAIFDPYTNVDSDAAKTISGNYRKDLEKAQGALSKVQGDRGNVTASNLRAIDEAISGLKNSRYEGMVGLDPAVSAAMAAGFLKTTPGVAGNFMSELGGAMGNAAPVIANKQKGDRDSFALLAELQRKRGEFEAEPLKDQEKDLRAQEKDIMANIRAADTAALRGTTADQRAGAKKDADQIKADDKKEAEKRAAVMKAQTDARADVEKALAGADFVSPEDKEALYKDALNERVRLYNAQNPTIQINMPDTYDPQLHGERAKQVRASVEAKGKTEYNQKQLQTIRSNVESFVAKQYPTDIWQGMSEKDKMALIERQLHRDIADNNRAAEGDTKRHIVPPERRFDEAAYAAADKAAERTKNIGVPDDSEVVAEGLPLKDRPNAYSPAMTYDARKEKVKREEEQFHKTMKPVLEEAAKLPAKQQDVTTFNAAYANTLRKGLVGGKVPAMGDPEAQIMDKIVASFQLTNFPQGQGAVSEGERGIIERAGANRQLEPYAVKVILDAYTASAQRASEYTDFATRWHNLYKTMDGAPEAWRRYITSPEGVLIVEQNGKLMKNPARIGWKEYFGKENAASGAGEDEEVWDDTLGRAVMRKKVKK